MATGSGPSYNLRVFLPDKEAPCCGSRWRIGGWASELPNGQYLFCPDGSHLAHYDDQEVSMEGLIRCVLEVDETARLARSQP